MQAFNANAPIRLILKNPYQAPNANIEAHSNPQRHAGNTANVVIIQTYETPVMVRCAPST
jgi:hypothetical protein